MKQAKRNNFIYSILFLLILISFLYCSGESNLDEIAVKVYVENLIAEETYSFQPDSIQIIQNRVFEKYKITREDFEKYLFELKYDKKSWESFFKKADKYLKELKENQVIQ